MMRMKTRMGMKEDLSQKNYVPARAVLKLIVISVQSQSAGRGISLLS